MVRLLVSPSLLLTIALMPIVLIATSCVSHRAGVDPATPPAEGLVLGAQVLPGDATDAITSPLPTEVPVTLWRRDADGALFRSDAILRTPTPWWQRFPSDLVTDALLPGTYTVAVQHQPVWTPAGGTSTEGLEERARAAGYARPPESVESR